MIRHTLKKVYNGRWVLAAIVCVFVLSGGIYVIYSNQQAINASRDARDAALAASASAGFAAESAQSSAQAAIDAKHAPCKAITEVADVFNPFAFQFRLFISFFLKDRAQAIFRAKLAVKNAKTPAQKSAALLAQRQLKGSLKRFDALAQATRQVGPLAC